MFLFENGSLWCNNGLSRGGLLFGRRQYDSKRSKRGGGDLDLVIWRKWRSGEWRVVGGWWLGPANQ